MYKQVETAKEATLINRNGGQVTVHPVATMKNEHGSYVHIFEDDHCYVLMAGEGNRNRISRGTNLAWYWFPEAIDILRTLPTPEYPKTISKSEEIKQRSGADYTYEIKNKTENPENSPDQSTFKITIGGREYDIFDLMHLRRMNNLDFGKATLSAKEAADISVQNVLNYLFKMIEMEALKGNRKFEFKGRRMSDVEIKFFEELGYKVQYIGVSNCIRISW